MTITKTPKDFEKAQPLPVKEPVAPPLDTSRFDKALEYVLLNEGGFSNDPRDPGGSTKWGVIHKEYEEFLGRKLTSEEIRDMPLEAAKRIYIKKFWKPIRGDEYTYDSVATVIFDTAVNKGLTGCLNCLRDAVLIPFDTVIPYSVNVINQVNGFEEKNFLGRFSAAVLRYNEARVKKYPNMAWAKKGWDNRARRLATLERNK
jgi:lysozyme family protein